MVPSFEAIPSFNPLPFPSVFGLLKADTEMGRDRSKQASTFIWVLVAGFLSQNLVIPVMSNSFEDQKTYYSPDPHAGSPPRGSHKSPSHGTSPSHGSGGSYGGTTPSHGTPSRGSGGKCDPTPSTPPSGGSHNPTPSTPPSGGSYDPTPSTPPIGGSYNPTPSTPTGGGGGYYHSPPTSGGGGGHSTPAITPPTTPIIDPGTPGISIPSPPYLPDPNTPPFTGTCNYWRTHPGVIWGLVGWWGTVGGAFGVTSIPGFGASLNLMQALSNTRTDGIGALYQEGTASLLNSMVNKKFPFTTKQVRDNFVTALDSNKAAAAQAQLFKLANESRLKPRA